MAYCVYKHTSPSGKVYIGITSRNVNKRWQRGKGYLYSNNMHFYNAIMKYGWDNFTHEVIETGLTKEEAEHKEVMLIEHYKANDPRYGYNIRSGGQCRIPLPESVKKKISESHRGEKNGMYGKHKYPDGLRKYFETHPYLAGEKHPQWGKKGAANANYGRRNSQEVREKMSVNNPLNKAVRCVETGIIYRSGQEAMRKTGIQGNSIMGCCNHKPHYHTAGGYHWEFV